MDANKGNTNRAETAHGPSTFHDSTRNAAGLLLLLVACSCATVPSFENAGVGCDAHGVKEERRPMASRVHVRPLHQDDLSRACASVRGSVTMVHAGAEVTGCLIPRHDGTALAFYRVGDVCAMRHELCHALHGPEHTDRYLEDLANGMSLPYCPPNPLSLVAR